MFRVIIASQSKLERTRLDYYRLKRMPEVMAVIATKEPKLILRETDKHLFFGSSSDTEITAFLSLKCQYCAHAFKQLTKLFNGQNRAAVRLILIMSEPDSEQTGIMTKLSLLKKTEDEKASLDFLIRWYGSETETFSNQFSTSEQENGRAFILENARHFQVNRIQSVPSFYVNGHKLPNHYAISEALEFSSAVPQSEIEPQELIN